MPIAHTPTKRMTKNWASHFFKNIHASFKVMTHGNQLRSSFVSL
jgi:hypothetical protein